MKLNKPTATFFIPDQKPLDQAIQRTTHMSIAAHHDDIEVMAYDGILKCLNQQDQWFFGVIVTNGAGSSRTGDYANYSDEQMQKVRKEEQIKASILGNFGALAMLDYTSLETKDYKNHIIIVELANLIKKAQPKILYTHNLADKHDTHIGVTLKVIQAIRTLDKAERPQKLFGCEVWRNLDWMLDEDKVVFDVSKHPNLAQALIEVFDSQISGGKRYDLATIGRRLANATYSNAYQSDQSNALIYGMDLTPLIEQDDLNIIDYVEHYINRFKKDVEDKIKKNASWLI
jgi:LmbE family N-acetylglucosaminyl deacetylase